MTAILALTVAAGAWAAPEAPAGPSDGGVPVWMGVAVAAGVAAVVVWAALMLLDQYLQRPRKGDEGQAVPPAAGAAPPDEIWGKLFAAANPISQLVLAAYEDAGERSRAAAEVARDLVEVTDRLAGRAAEGDADADRAVKAAERALGRLGYGRVEPGVGEEPPPDCDQWPEETADARPGTVVHVLTAGWRRQVGDSYEVLRRPAVSVARPPAQGAAGETAGEGTEESTGETGE
jgi:hypothetical protein